MNECDVLGQSRLSVELFAAQITHQRHVIVVMEHVRSQLRVLNEIFAANVTLVIPLSRVRFDVPIQRLFGGESIAAHWT